MRYKVSPTDLSNLHLGEAESVDAILRNIAVMLATRKGSVPLYREFGLPWDFVDKPMPVAKAMMVAPVREALERWEPRAAFVDIDFKQDLSRPGHQPFTFDPSPYGNRHQAGGTDVSGLYSAER